MEIEYLIRDVQKKSSMKWTTQTGDMEEVRDAYRMLIWIPEVKIHLRNSGISRRIITELGCDDVDCTDLTDDGV
jgi:hypothetical protein